MFNFIRRLIWPDPREDFPVIVERMAPKKDYREVKTGLYNQVGDILDENAVYSSLYRDQIYVKLKKSLQRVNEIMDSSKGFLDKRDIPEVAKKVSSYKDDRSLSMMTYDVSRLISSSRYEDPAVLKDRVIKRILNWYGLNY